VNIFLSSCLKQCCDLMGSLDPYFSAVFCFLRQFLVIKTRDSLNAGLNSTGKQKAKRRKKISLFHKLSE
jgi:hypothetical protein